jgi:hypothetical protein
MKIADVMNERSKEYYRQENSHEYAYITADEYTSDQLVQCEKHVLKLLKFRLCDSTTFMFLTLCDTILKLPQPTKILAHVKIEKANPYLFSILQIFCF